MNDMLKTTPDFTIEEAQALLAQHFGLNAALTPLDSERDQNFKVSAGDGRSYILKIINAAEPEIESDFQTALLAHLGARADTLPVPHLQPALSGESLATTSARSGLVHRLRLVSWIEGMPLAQSERTDAALRSLGHMLGRFDASLKGFMHPGALRDLDWDIRNAGRSAGRLLHVADPQDRALLQRFIDRFEERIAPRLPMLRSAVIHNDANDWNVLVGEDDRNRISGIIDFGDALYTPVMAEVAIAAAYAGLDHPDPIGAAAAIANGYHAEYPLLEEEVDLLFDLIAMRLVTSVTISASRRAHTGGNPYLAISERPAWALLRKLDAMNPRFATAILRKACGFEAVAGARAVGAWIDRNRKNLLALLDRPAAAYAADIVPYGDPAHPMTVNSAAARPHEAQSVWTEHCRGTGVELGIGPWGEARTVYSGEMFVSRLLEKTRRSRHLGLDLFKAAGTKVYTPLAATVASVEIETDPLGYGCLVALRHEPEGCPPFLTLWGHLAHEAVGRLKAGDTLEAGALVGEMGAPEENGGWAPHLHLQICTDTGLSASEILGVGEERYLDVWSELFPDASAFAGVAPEFYEQTGRTHEEIVRLRKDLLLSNLSISYEKPIKFVRGEGVWLIDDRGRAYLDCFNNVCHIGHAHPAVVEAIARQAATLNTNTRYLHDNIVAYAERLTSTLPKELAIAAFANSGSEANSLALRLMRAHTGRENALVLDWAYHGTTQELIDLSAYKFRRKGGRGPKSHVHVAAVPDSYHAPADWPAEEHGKRFAEDIAELIAAMRARGEAPGFFLAESIPSVAGQVFLPDGYLKEVYRMVRDAGGVCIADEVQVGFGRVGSHWWAFETQGVVPDVVTMGKPIGAGHPLAAVVTTREIAASFDNGMEYFNTFGGNPVSCAAGLAVLDVIEGEDLRRNALEIGNYLLAAFRSMQERYEVIGDIRGLGLFLGIELVSDRSTKAPATEIARAVSNGARQRGVLMGTEGPHDNVLKMRPPMIFSKRDADHLIAVLAETFGAVLARAG
ncbi:aminotransferase class III-fold pyridoxal phosphate-dependent enzyme [Sinorhizobium medicae]|uniref:aminotransferase class III-fold pyridoxal phosphate-dependent enzyme n=1 Tax=Sinorhizobium medicae TaxID=110321 RepID=UPI002AF6C731|nr:aminotransferase class III-fold pyridoxal phosphate-dependent enzyme [Sinorhizobium medicae]WQO47211.1 aminotransferase class III-fold pyridoxal phosphate-dependent enzyme [Sinorhizobium medicae]WQO67464.1 aminotransferase class III-fold pyridoxal phosphate-dependent enzyme [Sinorhizobium medicae]WQO74571.1 aminotransferase class III-fold pyridoxal phosphate-dependent enzyme [Sinorhizobium medicae]WQO90487.1 aminotransferase class III-fold pyridoxal phosphate-dependent enzyme [Sinorhizobium 